MKIRNLHQVERELVHGDTVLAWTLFQAEDFLSDILFFNDNLVQPGVAIERHEHKDVEEIYYIVSGRGKMTAGDEEEEVTGGDAIYLPPLKVHSSLENAGTHPLRFICVGARTVKA